MDKARWIGKRVRVKPGIMFSPELKHGWIGRILDIKESEHTPGLYLTAVADNSGDYRWLYPSEFIAD